MKPVNEKIKLIYNEYTSQKKINNQTSSIIDEDLTNQTISQKSKSSKFVCKTDTGSHQVKEPTEQDSINDDDASSSMGEDPQEGSILDELPDSKRTNTQSNASIQESNMTSPNERVQ